MENAWLLLLFNSLRIWHSFMTIGAVYHLNSKTFAYLATPTGNLDIIPVRTSLPIFADFPPDLSSPLSNSKTLCSLGDLQVGRLRLMALIFGRFVAFVRQLCCYPPRRNHNSHQQSTESPYTFLTSLMWIATAGHGIYCYATWTTVHVK